jgi:hypothetical protein
MCACHFTFGNIQDKTQQAMTYNFADTDASANN